MKHVITMPLVSVIIPAYNNELHLREAIDSVLAQEYSPLEIIVVDDGSTDRTADIVASYGDRVILLRQENQGSAVARNTGIKHARGKYIAFLDADDVWWKHKLDYQVSALEQSEYKMAYSRFIWWPPDGSGQYSKPEREFGLEDNPGSSSAVVSSGWIYPDLLLDCIVWTSTVVVEKTALETAGWFDPDLRKGQDYDLWLRLSRYVPMLGLEQPTALYRKHSGNITASLKPVNYEYFILSRAIERWGVAAPDGRKAPEGLLSARLYRSCFHHGYSHLKQGNPDIAIEALSTSMRHSGIRLKTLVFIAVAVCKKMVRYFGLNPRSARFGKWP